MVDGRSNISNISGSFSFKSGDISGTAAKLTDEKMGQGSEYFLLQNEQEEQQPPEEFIDRSAQLRATLNSLAMANVATLLKNIRKPFKDKTSSSLIKEEENEINDSIAVSAINENPPKKHNEHHSSPFSDKE